MCSTLPMTKCQCKKPAAQSAPLCRGVPRSTLAVRLAALHRNNNLPIPELKSASSSFPFIYFSGSMLFTSVPPPVDFCVMSSLRTQANVKACKLLRNAPPTQSGGWIVAPTCKLSQRACISLFVLALFFDAEQCCSVITSLTGISQFARQSYQPIPWCPGGFTAEPCVSSLSSTRSFVCLCFQ